MTDNPSCSQCRFFSNEHCRRFPPSHQIDASDWHKQNYGTSIVHLFPRVYPSDWCGEFQPKETNTP